MRSVLSAVLLLGTFIYVGCKKGDNTEPPATPTDFSISSWEINGGVNQNSYSGISVNPVVRFYFPTAIDNNSASSSIVFQNASFDVSYQNGDSVLIIQPKFALSYLSNYKITIYNSLRSKDGGKLIFPVEVNMKTGYDQSNKFPAISDDELLTKVQQQTFKYFWDFAHPASGLARERSNGDNNVVTTGGTGFGVMAIVAAIHRGFINRQQGLERVQQITSFLKNTAQTFKGAYPHWLHGATGAVIPFSAKDDGADLVETSFLMQGLLCARQYFDKSDAAEVALRNDINSIWQGVDWNWFRQNNQDVLYWHWSPNFGWDINLPIKGWNECLITYLLASASPTHPIPASAYHNGWASAGAMKNGAVYFNHVLPLGQTMGGPLFLSQYSFLGINPRGLSDSYANYEEQTTHHARINQLYCIQNPKNYFGYSDSCWGLTASDIQGGYTASSPTNDVGVIAPTAAISALPYTPEESMKTLKFFYYILGDKLWQEYGFIDAFSLNDLWFADSFLAIDQGPQIIMIENYRSGLLWNLLMSAPEVKKALKDLGFTGPNL